MGAILSFFFGSNDPPRDTYVPAHRQPPRDIYTPANVQNQSRQPSLAPHSLGVPHSRPRQQLEARQPSLTFRRRLTVFHGTTVQAADKIYHTEHFVPSRFGIKGPGVYFSKNLNKALQFGPVILKCEVDQDLVDEFEDHGGIVRCHTFAGANGVVEEMFVGRSICRPSNRCSFNECRECRTYEDRKAERQGWSNRRYGNW